VLDGRAERRNGSIILMDEAGNERVRWNFLNAWPAKWTGPAFNATDNAVAVETLELAHEELKLA
jgi:phage tail-like protein